MTAFEMIEKLKTFPPTLEVWIAIKDNTVAVEDIEEWHEDDMEILLIPKDEYFNYEKGVYQAESLA